MPVHVDDGKIRATSTALNSLLTGLRSDEEISLSTVEHQILGKSIEFCGKSYCETPAGEFIDQNVYIKNKLLDINVQHLRGIDENAELSPADTRIYGTGVGRLIWVLSTQVRHSYEISFLSRFRSTPRVKHLRRMSKLIGLIRREPQSVFLPRFARNSPLKLITIVDASQGEEADAPLRTRDHQCVALILAAPLEPGEVAMHPGSAVKAGLLSYSSNGLARISHASFDFESIAAIAGIDVTVNVRELVAEVFVPIPPRFAARAQRESWLLSAPPAELHSDSMSLVKAVRLGVTTGLVRRRQRDVLDLRDVLSRGDLAVMLHINGSTNPADCGTKVIEKASRALEALLTLVHKGIYRPVLSGDYSKNFES